MTWTRDSVMTELTSMFGEYADAGAKISAESHLVADLGVDSLGVYELIQKVEDKFGLQIPDEALQEVETVGDVGKAIITRLEADGRLEG